MEEGDGTEFSRRNTYNIPKQTLRRNEKSFAIRPMHNEYLFHKTVELNSKLQYHC